MTRLKVALVTPRFPPDVGGLEGYVGWLAQVLQQSGRYDVTVITTGTSTRSRHETFHGIPVIRLGTWLTLSNTPVNPLWWWQVRRLLTRLDVDVVNAHAPVPGLADVAALRSPVPVVMTYHSGSMVKGGHPADALLRAYERHVLPRVFARCTDLVAVSPVSLAHATGRARLVPPGVDTDLFRPPIHDAPRGPGVLYVGRVERTSRWKGLHVLVDSLGRLRETVPDVRLDIVGDGDDVPALRQRAEALGVADAIEWHGRVEHDELPAYYQRAGVTVLPSLTESESFGMTLVEAMATGCPVVGSATGGIPFVVRDEVDGLLVPPGDAGALADALAVVLTDPARAAALGAAGREAARARWDWSRQEDRTLRVLDQAARPGLRKVDA
ncbi:glycosyltransferase family 4 protein [Marmoricola sp. URHB0036]|uniref:glycosyltransferase family 4 protein n=1 Tax=Marmoricola sp. URHB0036 TaxID=1298863 RepID=UPI0004028568|nr:glycosyltransferase family 4 protein [Marmoricola sp. URHB0036]